MVGRGLVRRIPAKKTNQTWLTRRAGGTRLRNWSDKLQALLREKLRQLTTVQASDRVWRMPFAAALASGLSLLAGVYFRHLGYELVSDQGAFFRYRAWMSRWFGRGYLPA